MKQLIEQTEGIIKRLYLIKKSRYGGSQVFSRSAFQSEQISINLSHGYLLKNYIIILAAALRRIRVTREDLSVLLFMMSTPLFYLLNFKGVIKTPIGHLLVNNRDALRSFMYGFFKTHFFYMRSLGTLLSANSYYPVVVDVGANIGDFTLAMTTHAGKIVAVEPGEKSFRALKANIQINHANNVLLLRAAAHEKEEEVFLQGNSSDMYVTNVKKGQSTKGMPLEIITRKFGVESIDILKIDVQGHEMSALLGTLDLLQDKLVKLLIIEVHLKRHVSVKDILSLVEAHNYCLIHKDTYLFDQLHLYFMPT